VLVLPVDPWGLVNKHTEVNVSRSTRFSPDSSDTRRAGTASKESGFGNSLIWLSHLFVLGSEAGYFPQATVEKYISSPLRVSCQGEIIPPFLIPRFLLFVFWWCLLQEHPSCPKGPLVNLPSPTHTDSSEHVLPRSRSRHRGDKQPRASPQR